MAEAGDKPSILAPPPSPQEIRQLAADCAPFSDNARWQLEIFAELFIEAHEKFPDRPSLEIGTREGGGTLLFLRLVDRLYAQWFPKPIVVSCDPYGSKPYNDGHGRGLWENNPYSDGLYCNMKRMLAPFGNHMHFTLRGVDFLRAVQAPESQEYGRIPYWRFGRKRYFRNWSFAVLDGDHDAVSIIEEMQALSVLGCRRMVVDNADNDAKLWDMMEKFFPDHDIAALDSEGRARALAIVDDQEMKDARRPKEEEVARVEDEPAGVRDGE